MPVLLHGWMTGVKGFTEERKRKCADEQLIWRGWSSQESIRCGNSNDLTGMDAEGSRQREENKPRALVRV